MPDPRKIEYVRATVKHKNDAPHTQRAYVRIYAFLAELKTEPMVEAYLTEDAAIELAVEILKAVGQARRGNAG